MLVLLLWLVWSELSAGSKKNKRGRGCARATSTNTIEGREEKQCKEKGGMQQGKVMVESVCCCQEVSE